MKEDRSWGEIDKTAVQSGLSQAGFCHGGEPAEGLRADCTKVKVWLRVYVTSPVPSDILIHLTRYRTSSPAKTNNSLWGSSSRSFSIPLQIRGPSKSVILPEWLDVQQRECFAGSICTRSNPMTEKQNVETQDLMSSPTPLGCMPAAKMSREVGSEEGGRPHGDIRQPTHTLE